MKRPRQHIIEEESIKHFRQIVPNEWVINEFHKDYGKDLHIEIFKSEEATGKLFIAQVKGSDQSIRNKSMKVKMSVDALRYYNQLEIPVLLVFYSTRIKTFWSVWANGLLSEYNVGDQQKSINIKLTADQIFTPRLFEQLADEYSTDLAYKVNIVFHCNSLIADRLSSRIIKWVESYFKGGYQLNQAHFPRRLFITIEQNAEQLHIVLDQAFQNRKLRPVDTGSNFLFKPNVVEDQIDDAEAEIVFELANRFFRFNPMNGLRLLKYVVPRLQEIIPSHSLLETALAAIASNCIHQLDELIDFSLRQGTIEQFIMLNSAFFTYKEFHAKYRDNLLKAIDHFPSGERTAELMYNLGNFYRFHGDLYKASSYFHACRKEAPQYLKRNYWWHEYGGILFLSGHQALALKFYEQSLNLDPDDDLAVFTRVLIADTYFHLHNFREAQLQYKLHFEKVAALNKLPSSYHLMKFVACERLIKLQDNQYKVDGRLSDAFLVSGEDSQNIDDFLSAIDHSLLNSTAWYNAAICYAKNGEHSLAYDYFEIAAVIQETDKETWFEAYIQALNCNNIEKCVLIGQVCIELFSDAAENDFVDFLSRHAKMNVKQSESKTDTFIEIINFTHKLFESIKKDFMPNLYQPPRKILRLIHPSSYQAWSLE